MLTLFFPKIINAINTLDVQKNDSLQVKGLLTASAVIKKVLLDIKTGILKTAIYRLFMLTLFFPKIINAINTLDVQKNDSLQVLK